MFVISYCTGAVGLSVAADLPVANLPIFQCHAVLQGATHAVAGCYFHYESLVFLAYLCYYSSTY